MIQYVGLNVELNSMVTFNEKVLIIDQQMALIVFIDIEWCILALF